MTRRIHLQLAAIVSNDGARCAAECPHRDGGYGHCTAFDRPLVMDLGHGAYDRCPTCIAAEQAAASVPSCEGAKHVESLATLATNAENNLAYIRRTFPGGDPRDTDWYAAEVAALVWAHKAAQAAAQEKP